jgi:hypothetical protein
MKNVNLRRLAAGGADELREGVSERGRASVAGKAILPLTLSRLAVKGGFVTATTDCHFEERSAAESVVLTRESQDSSLPLVTQNDKTGEFLPYYTRLA